MRYLKHQQVVFLLILCFGWGCAPVAEPVVADEKAFQKNGVSEFSTNLRGVYFDSGRNIKQHPRVGRLAVRLITPEEDRKVRLDYPFKSQDRFRFEVSSNRDGWLYVLHKSPRGEPQLLWPDASAEQSATADTNRIAAKKSFLVPPKPGSFVFDHEIGEEVFYLVIRSKDEAPKLEVIENIVSKNESALNKTATGVKPKTRVTQIGVRGHTDAASEGYRSVTFDPGTRDADPNIYFSAHPKNINDMTIFEFKLRHGD